MCTSFWITAAVSLVYPFSLFLSLSLCRYSTVLDAALEFQQQFVVPSTWKTEVKEESSSSEDDDEDEDGEQEEDASREEEEVKAGACRHFSLTQPPNHENVFRRSGLMFAGGSGAFPRGAG